MCGAMRDKFAPDRHFKWRLDSEATLAAGSQKMKQFDFHYAPSMGVSGEAHACDRFHFPKDPALESTDKLLRHLCATDHLPSFTRAPRRR
jgi:hypothetical protein